MMYVCAVLALVCLLPEPSWTNSDNLALLSGTLKTMQRAACDNEVVSLSCPRGTSISIQVARYGTVLPGGYSCKVTSPVVEVVGGECNWPSSMQYSLLQTVVEACQKKSNCKFSTRPKSGVADPCPQTRKFVEVAYKCRPTEFRTRSVCEDDVMRLSCNPYSRVAIYDAQYGRTAYEPLTCPQPQGVLDETCLEHKTEKVMQMCHGKRMCEIAADNKTFGKPCGPNTRTSLKVIYACAPLGVLTERYESSVENDEVHTGGFEQSNDLFDERDDDDGEKWVEPTVIPAAPVANSPFPKIPVKADDGEDHSIHSRKHEEEVKAGAYSKLLLYISIAVLIFIILIVMLIGVRCYIIRRSSQRSKAEDMYTTGVPNVFDDVALDMDNDVDVSHISGTFYDHPDMILYKDVPGSKGTMRAMRPLSTIYPCPGTSSRMYGVDYAQRDRSLEAEVNKEVMSPKTLSRYSSPNYYYG